MPMQSCHPIITVKPQRSIAAKRRRTLRPAALARANAVALQVRMVDNSGENIIAAAQQNWLVGLGAATGLLCLWKVYTFIRADADLRLLSKRAPPKHAFEDKVVWITGASQGLGEELAKYFAQHGAYLILSARSRERLEVVRKACHGKHAPEGVKVLPLDVTAPYERLQEAALEADEAFLVAGEPQGVDIVIHNAGASQRAAVEETSAQVIDSMFDLNVLGTLRLTRAVLPYLISRASPKHERRIVVVGSMAGEVPAAGQAVYAACKASVAAYFRTLHSELWSRGVRVTLCHPGPIATGTPGQPRSMYGPEGLITEVEEQSRLKKRLSPTRVAELIATAAYHGLSSCWIATHPILLLAYLVQYWPALGYWVANKIGPGRAASYKSGGSGYEFSAMLGSSKKKE